MKELPTPTFPFSQLGLRAALWPAPNPVRAPAAIPVVPATTLPAATEAGGISVTWARHQDDVRAAQRLRYEVFAGEMGARLTTPLEGHDIDLFDDFCEHLLVRELATNQVIGTYRVLTPAQARRIGSTYSDT
jgi:putative hemolysin